MINFGRHDARDGLHDTTNACDTTLPRGLQILLASTFLCGVHLAVPLDYKQVIQRLCSANEEQAKTLSRPQPDETPSRPVKGECEAERMCNHVVCDEVQPRGKALAGDGAEDGAARALQGIPELVSLERQSVSYM